MLRSVVVAAAKGVSLAATSTCHGACASAAVGGLHFVKNQPNPLANSATWRSFAAAAEPARADEADGAQYGSDFVAPHPGMKIATSNMITGAMPADLAAVMSNPVYVPDYLETVTPKHVEPKQLRQKLAFNVIQSVRWTFDRVTGYGPVMTEAKWLQRMLFLETVAGVPGMVAGMLRHLKSLRLMQHDNGWINTLLAEAENERMHLLTFLELRKPGPLFRGMVILAQGVAFNAYFIAYLLSPKTCHSMVGYLEEEAVKTYTSALKDIDEGKLWPNKPAPAFAINYWKLPEDATMRDLILAIRADEACHSHVNHTFAELNANESNPFGIGNHEVP